MKGLLGINYGQRLADDEDLMRMISLRMMTRKVVTKNDSVFFGFLCSLQVASFWKAQNIVFCATIFLSDVVGSPAALFAG